MRRILITGATGFIGRHLVERVVEQGHQVILLLREGYGEQRPLPPPLTDLRPDYQVVYADLRNYRLTSRAVSQAQPTTIIHLAAAGVTDPFLKPATALRHNLQGTLNLLRAAFDNHRLEQPVEQLLVSRTPGEKSAMNVYAASKAAAWNFCQMYARTEGWPIIGAMIYQAYGPGQPEHTLIPAALAAAEAGQDFPMTDGRQERDWIYISDVVAGLLATADTDLAPGTTVALGTGQLTSVAEVVGHIFALYDGPGQPQIGHLPNRPGEEQQQQADAARTRELLGWQAALSLPEGLKRFQQSRS